MKMADDNRLPTVDEAQAELAAAHLKANGACAALELARNKIDSFEVEAYRKTLAASHAFSRFYRGSLHFAGYNVGYGQCFEPESVQSLDELEAAFRNAELEATESKA